MWITKVSINQPVFATMVMLALLVLGAFSYQRLPVEQMPDVSNPLIFIQLNYPGASPEAIENDLIRPIENVVNTVNGVKRIYATAREGIGFLQVEFRLDTEMGVATQEVRDKIADLRPGFPREAKDPLVSRTNSDPNQQPVMYLALYSDRRSLSELSNMTEQIVVKRLQSTQGVGNVVVNGLVKRQIQVFLQPDQLQSFGISIDAIIASIRANNQDQPAGFISFGAKEQLVRVEGRIKNPKDFNNIIVAQHPKMGPIYLHQLATVVDGAEEAESFSRINGKPSLSISLFKIQSANIVDIGAGVEIALADLKSRLPADVKIVSIYSNAEFIISTLNSVKKTIFEGGVLTVFIVFLFLHSWRSTIITGLTLPISVMATFIVLHGLGFTLNFLTLIALSLCIGLLIDDAIVVRENIVRHLAMGKIHVKAAEEGTSEIGLAVTATTFAILAVFIPVAFMSGIIGRYFFQFGLTVVVAVLVSLFVSFTLDPMLSAIWHDPQKGRFKYLPWLNYPLNGVEHGMRVLHAHYEKTLVWVLKPDRIRLYFPLFGITHAVIDRNYRHIGTISHRGIILWGAASIFFGSFALVPFIGTEFIPTEDAGFTSLRLNTPLGSSLTYTDSKALQVETALKEFSDIEILQTEVGTEDGKNYARINVKLMDSTRFARRSQKDVEKLMRDRIAKIAGIELSVGFDKPIFVSLLGPDSEQLSKISQDVMAKMSKIEGIADLESSEKGGSTILTVKINRELASDLGVTANTIGQTLRTLISGEKVSRWLGPDGQDYDIMVRLPREQRQVAADLGQIPVASSASDASMQMRTVPLRQIATFTETQNPQQIKRQDLQRRVSLYAGAEGRAAGDVGADVEKLIAATPLPPGYRFEIGGSQQEMNESFSAALAALALAVIFIYFILASQFGSFLQPIAIMASLPLSLSGVFIALLITNTTLNLFSMIGFIMLMGLVTKNAILLVDFTNQSIRQGKNLHEALLAAGMVRLRPILMTTLAMIFGMLPMAIGAGSSGDLQAPMGRAVIGGVITSTLLTLVVVPVLYTYVYALGERGVRWFSNPDEAAQ